MALQPCKGNSELSARGRAPFLNRTTAISAHGQENEKPPAVSRRGLLFTHPRSRDQG